MLACHDLTCHILMQGSTDAAQAAADLVLTHEGLRTIVVAIGSAREIFCRLKNFICYRVAATLQLLVFFFVAVFAVKPIDYYRGNFCPANLVPTAITSCDAVQVIFHHKVTVCNPTQI